MLAEAGSAALQIPSLERMETWNGRKRNACVFRYQITEYEATLNWCGTDLELESAAVDAWKKAACLRRPGLEFTVLES